MRTEVSCGLEVSVYDMGGNELYVTRSGAGEIYAAAATQHLITGYGVELIVNFGICGGLTPEMSLCRICVVGSVVHYDFDTSPVTAARSADILITRMCLFPPTESFCGSRQLFVPSLQR